MAETGEPGTWVRCSKGRWLRVQILKPDCLSLHSVYAPYNFHDLGKGTSLFSSFHICKIGMIIVATSRVLIRSQCVSTFKLLRKSSAHRKHYINV